MEAYLYANIPLSRAMGVEVVEASPAGVTLAAPLEPNLNHRATAFGGSVAAVAVLAGWTLTDLRLREEGRRARTVIHSSRVRYDTPIHGAFRATCGPLDPHGWARLLRALDRRGRGRIRVPVEIVAAGEPAGAFEGVYVALAGSGDEERG